MALIDEWIEIAMRHNAGHIELTPDESIPIPVPHNVKQEQLEDALREIVPPDMLLRLHNGARFCFPYHTLGGVFSICLEKRRGVLKMRIAAQPPATKPAPSVITYPAQGSRRYRTLRRKSDSG